MVEAEKAILDSIGHLEAAGDIPEIAAIIFQGKTNLDWPKLVDYALKFKYQSLIQRLGFLLDFLRVILFYYRGRLIPPMYNLNCLSWICVVIKKALSMSNFKKTVHPVALILILLLPIQPGLAGQSPLLASSVSLSPGDIGWKAGFSTNGLDDSARAITTDGKNI